MNGPDQNAPLVASGEAKICFGSIYNNISVAANGVNSITEFAVVQISVLSVSTVNLSQTLHRDNTYMIHHPMYERDMRYAQINMRTVIELRHTPRSILRVAIISATADLEDVIGSR